MPHEPEEIPSPAPPPSAPATPGAPVWVTEIIRKLDAIWNEIVQGRLVDEDHEQRIRSLEATRAEQDRLRKLEAEK